MVSHLRLSLIGAGRVGRALGRLAREGGYTIVDVVCSSTGGARQAVKFIGAGKPHSAARAKLSGADMIIISTPDDRIRDASRLVSRIARRKNPPVVVHTSGALSSEVLHPLRKIGFSVGSCHPLQSFESAARGIELVKNSFFCLEGDSRAMRIAAGFVRRIGGRCFEIPTGSKALYHAAAVMASGGVTALVSVSLEMLEACGLSESRARAVLMPLVSGTVRNIQSVGPAKALTGPVKRGDAGTVQINLDAMKQINSDWAMLYLMLAARGLELLERAEPADRSLAPLRAMIKEGLRGR